MKVDTLAEVPTNSLAMSRDSTHDYTTVLRTVCWPTGSYPETLVLYRTRPIWSWQVDFLEACGARPIQLFEGSRR